MKFYWSILVALLFALQSNMLYAIDKIDVSITTHLGDEQQFQAGDKLGFLLSLDRAAHLVVIYVMADGQKVQLLPNRVKPTAFYNAGLFMALPNAEDGFEFTIQPPFGKETLYVFASDRQTSNLAGKELDNGLKLLQQDIKQIRQQLKKQAHQAWGESKLEIITEE